MPPALCISRWPSNFSLSSPEVTQAVEVAFNLKEGLRPLELITEDDLKACGLNLGEGPQIIGEGAGPSIEAILPAISAPLETNAGLRGGSCHSLLSISYFRFILPVRFPLSINKFSLLQWILG